MVTKIRKWGNSLGLRIPKAFVQEAGIEEGSRVDISIQGDRLVIQKVHPARYELDDLLSEIREENLHEEIAYFTHTQGGPSARE
jgi:antitoxin MazE